MMRPCTLAVAVSLGFPLLALAEVRYTITALPPLASQALSIPNALNTNGLVVGQQTVSQGAMPPSYQPVIWQSGNAVLLPLPLGWQGSANAVNGFGDVGGYAWSGGSVNPLPVVWTNNQVQMLDTLGMNTGCVSGINDQGIMVGNVANTNDPWDSYAVSWSGGQATQIGDFPAGTQASAGPINSSGQIIVEAAVPLHTQAFLWANGSLTPISSLGGPFISAYDINDAGEVVGLSTKVERGPDYAFLWKNGITTELPSLPTDTETMAWAINDAGVIVGIADDAQGDERAVIWSDGKYANLDDLISPDSGWSLESASAIADNGSIVGGGLFNGQYEGFLLTPVGDGSVPEPASLALFAFGVGALLRRRR